MPEVLEFQYIWSNTSAAAALIPQPTMTVMSQLALIAMPVISPSPSFAPLPAANVSLYALPTELTAIYNIL
jgi:hypothetical protein